MRVFKYRAAGAENRAILERDISSLCGSQFWSSSVSGLNDPCEGFYHINQRMVGKLKFYAQLRDRDNAKASEENLVDENIAIIEKLGDTLGIYSLASSEENELMWAHYANSHKGYCVEYDLEQLKVGENERLVLKISYKKQVPVFDILDYSLGLASNETKKHTLTKIIGTKSKKWSYEQEVRIITSASGLHEHPSQALKAVHLGMKISDADKEYIFDKFSQHNIQFYQMQLKGKSYLLESKLLST